MLQGKRSLSINNAHPFFTLEVKLAMSDQNEIFVYF